MERAENCEREIERIKWIVQKAFAAARDPSAGKIRQQRCTEEPMLFNARRRIEWLARFRRLSAVPSCSDGVPCEGAWRWSLTDSPEPPAHRDLKPLSGKYRDSDSSRFRASSSLSVEIGILPVFRAGDCRLQSQAGLGHRVDLESG